MEGGAVRIEQEDEEDQATRMENLALFEDMRYYYHQYGEEDSAAPPPPHDLSTQLRDAALTGYRVSAHKGVGRDLLDSDSNKSDYDWLMTPPDTPLSSSSDQEAMVKAMQQQMIVRRVQPLISSIKTARSRNSSADVLPWNNSTSTTQRRSSTGSLFSSCTASSRPFVSANPVPARTPSPTIITRQSFPDHTNNISRGSTPLRGGGRSQGSSPVRSSNNNNNFSRGRSPAKSHINRGNSLSSPRAILPVILDSFLSDTPVNLRTTDRRPSSQHAQLAAGYGHRGINQSSENLEKRTTKQSSIRRHSSSPTSKIQGSNPLLQSSRQHHWSGNSIDDNILVSSSSRRRVTIPEYDLDGRRLSTGSSRSSRDPPPLSNNAPSRHLLTKHYYYGSQAAQKDVATVGSAVLKRSLDSAAASRSSVSKPTLFTGPVTPTSLSSSGCSGRSLVSATVEERISSEAHEQHELQNIVVPSSSQKRALSNGKHSDNNVMQNSFDLGGNKDGVLLASDKLKEEALIQEVEKGLKSQKQEQVMKKHTGYSSQSLNSLTRTRNPLKDIDRGGSEHMEDLNHDGCTCYDVEEMPQEIIILNERAADMRLGNIGGVGGFRDQVYKRDTDIFCEASQEDNIGSVPQITSERQEVNRRETSNLRKEEELLDGGCEDPSSLSSQGCKNGQVTADDNDLRFENSSDVIGDSHGGAAGESSGDIKGREQVMRDRTPPTMSELKGEMDNAVALTTKLASAAKSSQIFRGSYRGGECRKDDYLQGSLMRSSVSMSSTSATSIDLSRSSDTISSTPSSASLESTHNGLNSGFQNLKSRSEIAQVSNGNKVVDVCSVEAQDVDKEARSVVRGKVNIKITANLYSDAKLKKLAGYVRTVSLNARNQKGTQDDQNGAEEILSHDGCFDYFMDVLASQKSLDPEMREPHANTDVLASSHALETSKGELSIEVDNPAIMKHLDSRLTSTSSLSEKQTSFRVTDTANASSNWELNKEDLGCSKPVPKLEVSGQSIGKIVEYANCLGSDTPKHLSSFKFGQKKTALGELENITTFEVGAEAMTLDSEQSISMSGTMTLAEATDKILFCSSIVHDLVYAAVALVGENDTENKNATLLIGSKPTSLDHDLLSDPTHSNHLQEPKFSSYNDLKNVGELLQPSTETE
ncbi:unnamed protein product, partial [Sphagnum jensenii]